MEKNDETSEMRIEHKLTSAAQNELWHKINENPHNRNSHIFRFFGHSNTSNMWNNDRRVIIDIFLPCI